MTDEVLQQGEEARNKAKQEREEQLARAVKELIEVVKAGAEADDPFKTGDAVSFLMERELRRKEARDLIDEKDGLAWKIETLNQRGKPKVLLPLVHTSSDVSKGTAEINQDPGNPTPIGVSEPPISAAPMNTGRQKTGVTEPLLGKGFSEHGLFPPGFSKSPKDLKEAENDDGWETVQ